MLKRDFSNLTSIDEALERILEYFRGPLGSERVPVHESEGRVLAENIVSNVNIPPYPSALMDGYAVRAQDTIAASEGKPIKLRVIGTLKLGEKREFKVRSGEACYIPTGAFLPSGADAVIKVEDVKVQGDWILISKRVKPGEYISQAGEDVRRGETIFRKGHLIRPYDLGILASLRVWEVEVVRRPKVAILSVGDELVDYRNPVFDEVKVIDSHRLMISQMVKISGAVPYDLGIAPDDPAVIAEKLREGLVKADIILTIGGCSQGPMDFVPDVIDSLGSPGVIVHGVAVKPGRVSGLAVVDGKPIIILPGLPQSTLVGFILFALPIIRRMLGLLERMHPHIDANMKEEIRLTRGIRRFILVKLMEKEGTTYATPIFGESNILSNIAKADGFILTSENETLIRKLQRVRVFLL